MCSKAPKRLDELYRSYIQAILDHDLDAMDQYVSEDVVHNGQHLGIKGYKDLLRRNIMDPDMQIEIKRLIADERHVAAVLIFTTRKLSKELVGVELDGTPFSYAENVVYDFKDGRITEVHSLVDVDVIKAHARQS